VAFQLRGIKHTPFCPNSATRSIITDFAVVFSIALFTVIDNVVFPNVQTERLSVPDTFSPTFLCCTSSCEQFFPDDCPNQDAAYGRRPWLVDLGDLNGKTWLPFMAALPALLAFILVFLDDGITWHLINSPVHKLKHGEAFNYDTLIIGLTIIVNSMFGLPWLVAATVRSLNHVNALAKKERNGRIVRVQETRLTGLFIHSLVLASIFALNLLKTIPTPVLYGIFLFMGLASLDQNQFFQRVLMFFMQPSHYPETPYTQHLKPWRMHLYTSIQLILFITLYVIKSIKSIAIVFPIIIAACIPIRMYLISKIFSEDELRAIDSNDDDDHAELGFTMRGLTDTEMDETPKNTDMEKADSSPDENESGIEMHVHAM